MKNRLSSPESRFENLPDHNFKSHYLEVKKYYLRIYLIILLVSALNPGFSQSNEIKIRFIGNCGLEISDGTTHIYSDFPYKSGAHHYMEYDESEIDSLKVNAYFVFTHKHSDHYFKGSLKKILKRINGKKVDRWNMSEMDDMNASIQDFNIQAFKTKHLFSFKHYSYLISWHGKKIFLSGDTKHPEVIGSMENLEWAFIPAWLFKEAIMDREMKIDTKMIGIYHIGPRDDIDIVGPEILMLDKQGEMISIPY